MSISYLFIAVAALAGFFFGAAYYALLGSPWQNALKWSEQDKAQAETRLPISLAVNALAQLVMAWIFAGLLLHLAKSGVPANLRNGLLSGAFCWAGFVATTFASSQRFQGFSWRLTAIDIGHWLGVLLLQGAILGTFAIRA